MPITRAYDTIAFLLYTAIHYRDRGTPLQWMNHGEETYLLYHVHTHFCNCGWDVLYRIWKQLCRMRGCVSEMLVI